MDSVSSDPWEYVADDLPDAYRAPERTLVDIMEAATSLKEYMEARVAAVLGVHGGRPGLLLSGGIDSIVTAAVLSDAGHKPTCVTVIGDLDHQSDLSKAEEAASLFGLSHEVVLLNDDLLTSLVSQTVDELGIDELWEVTAAIPMKAAFARLSDIGITEGPVFTGGGADVLLAGGEAPTFATDELSRLLWDRLNSRFIRDRQIPDFYERILKGDANRLFHVFQTRAAWEVTCRFDPAVLFLTERGRVFDKAALRKAAELLGVPPSLAWTTKEPLQVSSGVIGALDHLSRTMASRFPGATTYSNPKSEPASQVLARWAIREASRHPLG